MFCVGAPIAAHTMTGRKSNPTRQIELRQRAEDHVAKFNSVAVDHDRARMRSRWEQSSDKKIQSTQLTRAMDLVQAQHDEVLMARRMRLAELLKDERDMHEKMLENLVVTDDQRRERLMQKARDLRVQREELRKEESEHRRDQLFREQSALVREAESRIKVLHIAAERDAQLKANAERRQAEKEEEQFWLEQQREEQRKQAQRAQRDLQQLHSRAQQVNADLALQVEKNQTRKQQEKEAIKHEDDVYREEIVRGIKADTDADHARRMKQRQIADETKTMNEEIRVQKEAADAIARAEEKKELDDLLKKIADDERREQQRKVEAREQAKFQMKFVEAQMNAQAESETALDKRWQEENDRQWSKREAQWKAESNKRDNLMRNVYETRKTQIREIRTQEETDLAHRRQEHDALVASGKQLSSDDLENQRKRRLAAIENRKFLERQVAEKQAISNADRDAKRNELTASQAVEKQYEAKISQELHKLDDARPQGFQHVKLGSKKRAI